MVTIKRCIHCEKIKKHKAHGMCDECYYEWYRNTNREKMKLATIKWRRANGRLTASENKSCSTYLGVHIAEKILSVVFKDVTRMQNCNKGFDFLCSKGMKIDVKSGVFTSKGSSGKWTFRINKNMVADYFLCLAFDNRKDLTPKHLWLLPSEAVNNNMSITISNGTIDKWDEYRLDISKVDLILIGY